MGIVKHQLSFAAGELSPWLDGRTDIEKYSGGCRLLENFIVLPQGAVQKRPGMEYLGTLPAAAATGRLVEFQVSTAEAVMLVIGGGEMKVYADGKPVMDRSLSTMVLGGNPAYGDNPLGPYPYLLAGQHYYPTAALANGKPCYTTDGEPVSPTGYDSRLIHDVAVGWRVQVTKDGVDYFSWIPVLPGNEPRPDLVLEWTRQQTIKGTGLPTVTSLPGTSTKAMSIPVPWSDAQLPKLRWKQINSVMYLVHPDHPPYKLTRYAADDWELGAVDIHSKPALLDGNLEKEHVITADFPITEAAWNVAHAGYYEVGDRVLHEDTAWKCLRRHQASASHAPGEPTAVYTELVQYGRTFQFVEKRLWERAFADLSAPVSMVIDLEASRDTWKPEHAGAVFEIAKERKIEDYEVRFVPSGANPISTELAVQGGWTFMTHGSWKGKFTIQRSEDKGETWQELRAFTAQADRNVSAEGDEPERVLLRVVWEKADNATGTGLGEQTYTVLSSTEPMLRGRVKIVTVVGPRAATAEVLSPVDPGGSYRWAESAWNEVQGYPRTVELHQGRVVMAATTLKPHTVWGSAVDDYENFERGTDADEAYAHTLAIGEKDPILWLISERFLLAGTGCGEWSMYGEDEEKAITPEYCVARRQSAYGAHDGGVPACFVDSTCFFVQRGGTRIREFSFSFQDDRYEAANLTLLADHLLEKPVEDIGVMRMPWQVVWFVSGGKLYGLTYERAQRVAAWHRHRTQGEVLSVATIRATRGEDEVWFVVKRGAALHLERFRPGQMESPADNGWWLDAACKVLPPFDFGGATQLHGKEVAGWYEGMAYPESLLTGAGWPFVSGLTLSGVPYPGGWPEGGGNPSGTYEVAGRRLSKPWFKHVLLGESYRIELAFFEGTGMYRWVIYIADQQAFRSQEFETWPEGLPNWPVVWTPVVPEVTGNPVVYLIGDAPADLPPPTVEVSGNPLPDATGLLVEKDYVNGRLKYGNYPPGFDFESDYTDLSWDGEQWVLYCRVGPDEGRWVSQSDVENPKFALDWVAEQGSGTPVTAPELVTGLSYQATLQPVTPEIGLGNGSSRSRELRIHRVVPSLRWSRGGKIGETPEGRLDPLDAGQGRLFTGEIEKEFDGAHGTGGDVCVVSDEPFPFAVRSLGLKMNVFGE
jgi:hypothetical protein